MSTIQIVSSIIACIMILPPIYVYIKYRIIKFNALIVVVLGFILIGSQSMKKIEISIGTAGLDAKVEQLQKQIETVAAAQDNFHKTLVVQAKLKEIGIYQGPINGLKDQSFVSAIEKYQKDKGLTANGNIDQKTLKSLSINLKPFSKSDYRGDLKHLSGKEGTQNPAGTMEVPTLNMPAPTGTMPVTK